MRTNYALVILGALLILPTLSLAQLRYQFGSLLEEPSWLILLTLFLLLAVGYVYFEGRKMDQEFNSRYQMVGQKGGKARRKKNSTKQDEDKS